MLLLHGGDRALAILVVMICDRIHAQISVHHHELVEARVHAIRPMDMVIRLQVLIVVLFLIGDNASLVEHGLVI